MEVLSFQVKAIHEINAVHCPVHTVFRRGNELLPETKNVIV